MVLHTFLVGMFLLKKGEECNLKAGNGHYICDRNLLLSMALVVCWYAEQTSPNSHILSCSS